MPDTPYGQIETTSSGYVIRFERHFDQSVDEVWDALTRPERLQEWTGATEIELDLVEGGRLVSRTMVPPDAQEAAGQASFETVETVLRVEAPHIFEHTFGGAATTVVRWELEPDAQGCRLRLTHSERTAAADEQAINFLAGWHDLLDTLGGVLAGPRSSASPAMERWEGYRQHYAEVLGIDLEEAPES